MKRQVIEIEHQFQHSVILTQTRKGSNPKFTVQYGLQVKHGLTYSEACDELGSCIMHAAACNGDIE